MAKLTSKQRRKLPAKDFALPGGRYPLNDKNHARNALARVSQHGTPEEKAAVRKKVHAKYPSIGSSRKSSASGAKKNRKRVLRKG